METVTFTVEGQTYECEMCEAHYRPTAAEVRNWARSQGIRVNARGRIPAESYAAYDAAHGVDNAAHPGS